MEPVKIDWGNIEWRFVEDEVYENINAPKWIDFSAKEELLVEDEAWFCQPDCRHPKTHENFLRSTPHVPKVKHQRSASVSKLPPLLHWNLSAANSLKKDKKSMTIKPLNRFEENGENENPNVSTPQNYKNKLVKSSTEKKKRLGEAQEDRPRIRQLKNTVSMSNLFSRKEIFTQITGICNDLKKMVTRRKERENTKSSGRKKCRILEESSGELNEREKEKKPLLEVRNENIEPGKKEKQKRNMRNKDAENVRTPVNSKVVGHGKEENFQVRTRPPYPQSSSTSREPLRSAKATSPFKPFKSNP
ncbi:hypothetical protein GIB67_018152 [Kingdonia uniflora]|uniref:Uncharacterized protein n=1 Tax=Kingdonia uniflora TaxID=39325 RepID=A0A7J7NMY9_9MAGN|nr:hypothetical protein GIB67_018152 [Kingdonia uniflora]